MNFSYYREKKLIRLQKWNYSWKGTYFVTIKTRFNEPYFGEIINGKMILSEIGREVEKQWLMTPDIRKDMNLELDEFVVMPDHFHGIIHINRNEFNSQFKTLPNSQQNKFGPQRKNLGSILRGFKSSVTMWCRINKIPFKWQGRYHDRLIRNEIALEKVRKYIKNNVSNWDDEHLNS